MKKEPGVRSYTKQNCGGGFWFWTEELPDVDNRKNIGENVVAVYEEQWFLAEIAKDQSGVGQRYTRLKYMTIKGSNAFAWGHEDVHTTLSEDILIEPVLPELVSRTQMYDVPLCWPWTVLYVTHMYLYLCCLPSKN